MHFFSYLLFFIPFFADFVTQQTIIFSVTPHNEMGQIIGPAPVFSMTGGSCSDTCVNTYSVATNEENKKISAYLDADMPLGTTLSVNLTPPSGARTLGDQVLSSIPTDLVIEISKVREQELPLVYTLEVSMRGGIIPTTARIVTYTLTDG